MNNEIEYIEPTQEHVGQMVEVRDRDNQIWKRRQFYGIIKHPLYRFVAGEDENGTPLPYTYARIPRPLTYAERQARCGLKVGDRVKVVRDWDIGEFGFSHNNYRSTNSTVPIGASGKIDGIHSNGISIKNWDLCWLVPYFVLEKVEDRIPSVLDHMAKVYVVGSPQDEFVICHMFSEIDSELWKSKHFAVVRSGDKRFVYELSNLRVKE